jgi:superfamily II DNA or RNA helicase
MVVDHCGDNRTVHLVYGATPTDDRERVRELVEKDTNAVIVASYGTFSTGVNIKRIHAIIFASPYKSQVKILQSLGRGLRIADDKEELELFDIADDLVYNGKENYTIKHLQERIQIYSTEGFDYDIIPVKLDKNK